VWRESGQAQAFIESNELVTESGLHHYFFQRMALFLAAHNRQAIGWDEILGKGNLENTSVMVWQDTSQAALAEKQGLDIIMSPREFTYLNYYQGEHSKEPLAQCCSLPIEKVYQLSAYIDGLSISKQQSILGVQASLWTEYIKTQKHFEYMLMPRVMALAEIAWTEPQKTQWSVFEQNYLAHFALLDYFGVEYREKR
jgi:hexosaminidase